MTNYSQEELLQIFQQTIALYSSQPTLTQDGLQFQDAAKTIIRRETSTRQSRTKRVK